MENGEDAALKGVRILDFANPVGLYCTKLFAELGADVIKVEPPGGDPARNLPPFFKDEPHPEKSLYWFHFNANKRSITLNMETPGGQEILKKLVKAAHIMIETYRPGYLDNLDLGYDALRKVNSSLVLTSITGFGQTGPWRDYKTSDMVAQALGGLTFVCGWPDRPPLKMGGSIAFYQASIEAAAATLIAYYHSLMTGDGQHIDASVHESMPICIQSRPLMYQKAGVVGTRLGDEHSETMNGIFSCKDGFVDFRLLIPRWDDFVKWLDSEDKAADLKEEKWRDAFFRNHQENSAHIDEVFRAFAANHTKKYIYEEGQRRGFVVGAVNTFPELEKNDQLAARRFFVNVEHPELGASLKYLGAPYKLSETPWQISRCAPLIGEHNLEIYEKELGFSRDHITHLFEAGII